MERFVCLQVLEGMFGLAERLFGVSVLPADGEVEVWHPDVSFFTMKNSQSGGENKHSQLLQLVAMVVLLLTCLLCRPCCCCCQ